MEPHPAAEREGEFGWHGAPPTSLQPAYSCSHKYKNTEPTMFLHTRPVLYPLDKGHLSAKDIFQCTHLHVHSGNTNKLSVMDTILLSTCM